MKTLANCSISFAHFFAVIASAFISLVGLLTYILPPCPPACPTCPNSYALTVFANTGLGSSCYTDVCGPVYNPDDGRNYICLQNDISNIVDVTKCGSSVPTGFGPSCLATNATGNVIVYRGIAYCFLTGPFALPNTSCASFGVACYALASWNGIGPAGLGKPRCSN